MKSQFRLHGELRDFLAQRMSEEKYLRKAHGRAEIALTRRKIKSSTGLDGQNKTLKFTQLEVGRGKREEYESRGGEKMVKTGVKMLRGREKGFRIVEKGFSITKCRLSDGNRNTQSLAL